MNFSKTIFISCLAGIVAFSSRAQQTDQPILQQELHAYLADLHLNKGFSGEVLIAKGDSIVFQEAIGLASVEQQVKLKPGAGYRIASLSKTFTATLIALAEQEGRLAYSDKASLYCKGMAGAFNEITLHQLLTHTSGLPHNEAVPDYWKVKSKLEMSDQQVLEEINRLDLLFAPGTQQKYSSLGYVLLAQILEEVYGKAFEDILQEKILSKLQLANSSPENSLKIIPGLAKGYHLLSDDSLVAAPYRNYSMLKGAGDMVATAPDLLKWSNSFRLNQLLSEKTKELLFSPAQARVQAENRPYGYGWFIGAGKPKKYFHGGGTWGYSSYIAHYPEEEISIILLSNVSLLPVESIGNTLEKMLFDQPYQKARAGEVEMNAGLNLEAYSGNFISDSGSMKLYISCSKNRLFARLGENPAFQIYPKGGHRFFGKKVDVLFAFEMENGKVQRLTAERMGQRFNFKRK